MFNSAYFQAKATLLGALFLIDFMYFEQGKVNTVLEQIQIQ